MRRGAASLERVAEAIRKGASRRDRGVQPLLICKDASVSPMKDAIVICWVVFLAFWGLAALRTKRTVQAQSLRARLLPGVPVFVGVWLLLKGSMMPHPFRDRVLPHIAAVGGVGFAITLLGLSLALWARVTLGGNWSGRVTLKENHELVRHGPYAHVRHPIYTALLTMFIGTVIAAGTLAALVGIPLVLIGIRLKAGQEEALMSEHFPAEYASYMAQVGALLPRRS